LRATLAVLRIFDGEKEAEGAYTLDVAAVGEQGGGTWHRRSRERLNDRPNAQKTASNPIAGSAGSSCPRPTALS
jgi:hypothetical protein